MSNDEMKPLTLANGFMEGAISYTMETMSADTLASELATAAWKDADGYIALSNTELRLGRAKGQGLLQGEKLAERIDPARGYVMEVNVWTKAGTSLCELSAEREDDKFIVQKWLLNTAVAPGAGNCWHKKADILSGSHHRGDKVLFGKLESIEVVWPEHRLNFFITTGGE